ncbi:RNA polymerase, partial (mitochondrion) [Aspergillus udagawae]
KQIRALIPNLIHILDATSLSLLYEKFTSSFKESNPQFFSVYDCFGTTPEKVFVLKIMLASVYTDIYSSDPYLYKFYKNILDFIQ